MSPRLFDAVFWSVAALDAVLLTVMLAMTLQSRSGRNDGGRAMAIFFFITLPAGVLAVAMLLFHFGPMALKWVALFIVLVPGLWFAKGKIEGQLIDRRIEAERRGVGASTRPCCTCCSPPAATPTSRSPKTNRSSST